MPWQLKQKGIKPTGSYWTSNQTKLKQERKHCMEELHCNIVVMKGSQPKVLRLNLGCSDESQTPFFSASSSPNAGMLQDYGRKHSTPSSSPEEPCTSNTRSSGEISLSSSDTVTSLFLVYEQNPLFEGLHRGKHVPIKRNELDDPHTALGSVWERVITLSTTTKSSIDSNPKRVFWIPQNHIVDQQNPTARSFRNYPKVNSSTSKTELGATVAGPKLNQTPSAEQIGSSSIREAVSLGRTSSIPPPLCSLCQHKSPAFGKPPRRFDYEELEEATNGFSDMNFLAEGGFGLVHRGILKDGLVVAVKQLKFYGSQGDADFCRQVRVLSCAQHRNVVLLVGFCVQGNNRVLVYEYICNSSLDFHLHGNNTTPLEWHSRLKIAIGTARGLRYLHEDCRVGCIAHRDMRPSNILLTHNFEPLVADFGLVRLHTEWDIFYEEQIVRTSGYLAPEYFDGGKITEKVDIYAFGLVLLELITGQRITELQCYMGRQYLLSENLSPLASLEAGHILGYIHQLLDPSLASHQPHNLPNEVQAMGQAASLCLQQDPESRPLMSKVLRILEGGEAIMPLGLDLNSVGSRSAHMRGLISNAHPESRRAHSRQLSH